MTDPAQLPRLAARWEALNLSRSDHDAPFFQSHAWSVHVAEVRMRDAAGRFKPYIATVWRGSDLIGIWPLALVRSAGTWMARMLDDPFGQFAGVVFQNRADVGPGVAAVIAELRRVADGLVIEAVVGGSALHIALESFGARTLGKQQAVFVDISSFKTFKDFEQSLKGETRRRLRNRAKRLREAHQVEHVVTTERARLEEIIGDVYDERAEWLQRNGRFSAAFRDENYKTLLTELARTPGVELIGFSLVADGVAVSTHWGFLYGGRYYWYMSGMKSGYDEFSPGLLHLGMIVEACIERGLEGLEWMPPASRYKLEWTNKVKDVETMIVPFNLKGRAMLGFKNNVLPAAKRISRILPDSVRRTLVRQLSRR